MVRNRLFIQMQDSKVPTLSIGPRKPKVFGKPNQSPQSTLTTQKSPSSEKQSPKLTLKTQQSPSPAKQTPQLTLTTQKSPSSSKQSPSVTPKSTKNTISLTVTTSANSNSSKKPTESKVETNFSNENNSIAEEGYNKNSQKSTPLRRKDSRESFNSEKDRASVASVSSAKRSISSTKQKSIKTNDSKLDTEQNLELPISNNDSKVSSGLSTPLKTGSSEKIGKIEPPRTASSAKKVPPKQISMNDSPASSLPNKQQTTPTSKRASALSSAKSNPKNDTNSNKNSKASTPNNKTNNKKQSGNKNKTFSTEDDSYDYSPTNSPKRRRGSPQNRNLTPSPIVKDIIPLVKSLLESNNNDTKKDSNEDAKEGQIINEIKLSDGAESLEEWQRTIISKASPLEEVQIQLWYDSLIEIFKQQNFYVLENSESTNNDTKNDESTQKKQSQKICYLDEIIAKSREELQNHRFQLHGGHDHRLKLIITGPNRSGKSTYLSILAQQLLFELIACGDWKKTFIFAIDFSTIAHLCQDLDQLFIEMSRLSIQALCAQRPLLIKYKESLTESFAAVVNGKPSLSRTFQLDEDFRLIAPQLQQLLDICYECYHDSKAMTSFTANCCMLPFFISNVFGGFSNVIVIADHFDLSDVTKTASQPFEDSPDNVFIAEIFKYLFMQTNFIIGAKYEAALNEVLTSLDIQNSSFAQGIEFLTTYDIIKKKEKQKTEEKTEQKKTKEETVVIEEEEEDKLEKTENNKDIKNNEQNSEEKEELVFNVTFNDINENLSIYEELFDGCPLFRSKFDIVRDIAKRIEKGQKIEDDKLSSGRSGKEENEEEIDVEEEKLKLVIKIEDLLRATMLSQDGSPYNLKVKSATFSHKEKKQKPNGKKTES